jgi:hypothetical protein
MAMGPWSDPSDNTPKRPNSTPLAERGLLAALVALCVLAGLAVWASRYELGTAGGLPARLDRFTGEVIGCVPGQGCLQFIPAGSPALRSAVAKPAAAPASAPAGNAPAGNASSPAAPPGAR